MPDCNRSGEFTQGLIPGVMIVKFLSTMLLIFQPSR
jgi:hypothetical protein